LRSSPVGSYLVFYLPLPDGIEVIRVLHGSRDLDRLF
jgi:toxin ParE1/3/4